MEPAAPTKAETASTRSYAGYPFLNLKANRINLNGADWSRLRALFEAAPDTLVNILHIGDSHIQAEGSTSRTRALMQKQFGNAGRGLIIPFRIAGTNQPVDYIIASSSPFTTAKLLKQPWPIDMGFTGIAIQPESQNFEFDIEAKSSGGFDRPFSRVRIFCNGALPKVTLAKAASGSLDFKQQNGKGYVDLCLSDTVQAVALNLTASQPCNILGFDLQGDDKGVRYSAIGNNGATYSSYNAIGTFGRDIAPLSPDLIIISMGCNEAFGRVSDTAMRSSIDLMVKNIRRANPQAEILLTTPSDCQRTVNKRVKVGKRRYRTTKSFQHNENVDRLRSVILAYGRENGIATYDWYAVAGGDNSSDRWVPENLMSKDRIHLSWKGYTLMGELLYDALSAQFPVSEPNKSAESSAQSGHASEK